MLKVTWYNERFTSKERESQCTYPLYVAYLTNIRGWLCTLRFSRLSKVKTPDQISNLPVILIAESEYRVTQRAFSYGPAMALSGSVYSDYLTPKTSSISHYRAWANRNVTPFDVWKWGCRDSPHSPKFNCFLESNESKPNSGKLYQALADFTIHLEHIKLLTASKMSTANPSQWYKGQFLISTSQELLQHEVVNDVFDSDYMYWTKRVSDEAIKHILSHSLCFGVYALPESSSAIAG
jgi:hypothetical protein